ncbi:MAG: replication initiation factor domain-containing protein [Nitrosospira sp.]|nr:replication initiation factor domain-containing protein [Nitrosospira sp.]
MHKITVGKDSALSVDDETSQHGERARSAQRAAERPARADADSTPCSNYGEKEKRSKETVVRDERILGIDDETGEGVSIVTGRRHSEIVRHLSPDETASPGVALVDALAFTMIPPDGESYLWVIREMRQFLEINDLNQRNGYCGFKFSLRFGEGTGLMAWGGDKQRGRVYFSIQGKGCAMVSDWQGLADWLKQHQAAIKRADVAYDDFEGATVNIAWAVEQYENAGFNAGGRKPDHQVFGDWLDGDKSVKGRTLGIGNRDNGKYCRIYEKGKQLGDPESRWMRLEVEWRAEKRFIPFDILTCPGKYLAGAYPCIRFLSAEQSRIKTISRADKIAFDRAIENAKQHSGKLINLMLSVFGGDYAEVVERLKREGLPGSIEPHSYHARREPAMLDESIYCDGVPVTPST